MTRKEAQDFFREHKELFVGMFVGRYDIFPEYEASFNEAVEAIMNDDLLEPLPCPFCGGTDILVIKGRTFPFVSAQCSKCGAECGEVEFHPLPSWGKDNFLEYTKQKAFTEWNKRA